AVPLGLIADRDGDARISGTIDIGSDEFVDSDVDLLPDFWELRYFGSITAGDVNGDPDADSLSNRQEFEEDGTNPTAAPYYVRDETGNDAFDGHAAAPQGGTVGPKKTIQAALTAAQSGDTVQVASDTYTGTGNINLNFGAKNVVVRAPSGPNSTII